jgi:hypothetical protein
MQLIDTHISDVSKSYIRIQSAENELQSKWRRPLLSVYAQQRTHYDHLASEYNQQRAEFSRRLRIGVWMASILLILGIIILPGLVLINQIGDFRGPLFCFSPLLILSGLTGWAIIVVLWIWQRDQEKPSPPKNPLKSDLISPLLPIWEQGLVGSLPREKTHTDQTGDFRFIARLQSLQDEAFILYGLQLMPGENIDVIILGRKGIWVFEVIHQPGLIRWNNGTWSQVLPSRMFGRGKHAPVLEAGESYDQRWQKSVDSVRQTLKDNLPMPVNQESTITRMRGGLVFTHPKGRYDIPPGCPFNWGVVPFWLEKYQSFPVIDEIDDFFMFNILDSLLSRHHQVAGIETPHSMMRDAEEIVFNAEKKIELWIDSNKLAAANKN